MQHSAKMESFQVGLAVKDPQTRRLSNPEVATKHLARTERPFFSIEPIAPATSFVTNFPDMGSPSIFARFTTTNSNQESIAIVTCDRTLITVGLFLIDRFELNPRLAA
jgi:hypothetical protein